MKTIIKSLLILFYVIALPLNLSAQYITSYEIDFPEIPEVESKTINDSDIKILSAVYYTTNKDKEKNAEVVFDDSIHSISEGFTIPAEKVYKTDPSKEIAVFYAVYETQYPKELDIQSNMNDTDREEYFQNMRDNIINSSNSRLISYEAITNNSYEGKEIVIRALDDCIHIFNIYLLNNSSYLIEVKLTHMTHERNDKIKTFLQSFRLKELYQ